MQSSYNKDWTIDKALVAANVIKPLPPIARIRIKDARSRGNRVIVYPMKPRTPGFWLIVATVGLLALLPMKAMAGMSPAEVKLFAETKLKAEKGEPKAQYEIGYAFAAGNGVPKDNVEAVKWLLKSANQGNAEAQSLLGSSYTSGPTMDKVESLKWFRKAAEQGDVGAQMMLGLIYLYGDGVAKNEAEAMKWLRRGADKDDPRCQLFLGTLYMNRQGTAKDQAEAMKWFRLSAMQGDKYAQDNLADCYYGGKGVAKNDIEAYAYWNLAHSQPYIAVPEEVLPPAKRILIQQRTKELQKEIDAKIAAKKAGK